MSIRARWVALIVPMVCLGFMSPAWSAKKPKSAPAPSVPVPAPPEKVTTVEGITEYRLANGLRVLLFPDQTKQTITVNVTYLVGIDEDMKVITTSRSVTSQRAPCSS